MNKRILYVALLLFFSLQSSYGTSSCSSGDGSCIAADDFGSGGFLVIPANPDANNTSGTTNLIKAEPKGEQVARWIDSGFFTTGVRPDSVNPERSHLKVIVSGEWLPWGQMGGDLPKCQMIDCDKNDPDHKVCMQGGKIIDSDLEKIPCKIGSEAGEGWGLYGLIAISRNGSYEDPNNLAHALSLSPKYFRTFRMSPLKKGRQINEGDGQESAVYENYFSLDATYVCDSNGCVKDVHPEGGEYVMRGKLYFKILDRHYEDNDGCFLLNIVQGTVQEDVGFIEGAIKTLENKVSSAAEKLRDTVTKDSRVIALIRAAILLYMVISALSFMIGISRLHQGELVTRLFKFSLVFGIISDIGDFLILIFFL